MPSLTIPATEAALLTLLPTPGQTSVKLSVIFRKNFLQHPTMATTRVFFDMTADGAPVGKIIMEVRTLLFALFEGLGGLSCSAAVLA